MSELKQLRTERKLTQKQAAEFVGISLRSYKSYENDADKEGTRKYDYIIHILNKCNPIDETHGVLELEDLKTACAKVLKKYDVNFCYLFGSYAKGVAKDESDVDLLVDTSLSGLKYYGMVEELRTELKKKVDVLNVEQLKDNFELTLEVLKDGIKIYEQGEK